MIECGEFHTDLDIRCKLPDTPHETHLGFDPSINAMRTWINTSFHSPSKGNRADVLTTMLEIARESKPEKHSK